ncbi:MAG: 1-phosphofructokinase [Lachnospiraceae bacterium]|nr:1-phosphofructokinase [Lachnospiraceae bacterium]
MVYTVTLNPSLDYIVTVDDLKLGLTNRTSSEMILPGGKGVNVSTVLSNLGIQNTAFYFAAGFVGEEITKRIKKMGINADFITVDEGNSRINIKIKNIDGTEINGSGPDISKEKLDELMEKLDSIKDKDILALAGSIPSSVPASIYADIMERLSDKDIDIVVDASKDLLLNVLKYRPFLIKPNNHELGEIFGIKLDSRESVIPYANKLRDMGAKNVLVSLAGKGAVLVCEDGTVYESEAPEGELVNAVGAGDSMVAGFIAGWLENKNMEYAFKMGIAAGSASAFSEYLATREEIIKVYSDFS